MQKLNCWEIKQCGREPGGANAATMGVCRTASDNRSNGINNGKNGGRVCWTIAGTFCGKETECKFAQEQASCMACEVFRKVKTEEGADFSMLKSVGTYCPIGK